MKESSLVQRFNAVVRERGEGVAIVDDFETVSHVELGRRVHAVAAALRARGLAGRRVALLVTQGSGWVEAFFGIVLAGGVAVPLSHLHPEPEQRWFTEASGASALLVSADLADRARGFAGERPVIDVRALVATAPGTLPASHDSDVALILYTSGTTGKPKGALISHENLASVARLLQSCWGWRASDALLHALPLHHLHGLAISLLTSLLSGGQTRMLARFDAAHVWNHLHETSVLMGVPTMHRKLLDALDAAEPATRERWQRAARGLRLVTSGSAALPATTGERWRTLTGAYPLERFGMTEIGVGMSNPLAGERVPGTTGPVLPGMQVRIVDDHGRDVAPGESGEIWLRGPSVFLGYDGNPEATHAAFVDGWFRSGDTATFTPEGYVKILGRTSVDILKSGGYKLSALEIEEVLREHPALADVAVVGLPDDTWGEIAVAAVLLQPGAALEPEALRTWAKQFLAPYKVPRRVVVLEELPRNPVGKVIKPELVKLLA